MLGVVIRMIRWKKLLLFLYDLSNKSHVCDHRELQARKIQVSAKQFYSEMALLRYSK